jgi:hypothetical protein
MIEVRVDFNSRGHHGLVRANKQRASGPVVEGQKVLVVDPYDEELRFVATVEQVEPSGRLWLAVHWDVVPPNFNFAQNSEPATGAAADQFGSAFRVAYLTT